jgi:hypothetical protein
LVGVDGGFKVTLGAGEDDCFSGLFKKQPEVVTVAARQIAIMEDVQRVSGAMDTPRRVQKTFITNLHEFRYSQCWYAVRVVTADMRFG